jgi:hypothetical protein
LARDRGAALIVQAATAGTIDFSRSDPRNAMWLLKVRMICDQIEANNYGKFYGELRARTLASLARSDLTQESYDKLNEHASTQLEALKMIWLPWTQAETVEQKQTAYQNLYDQWVDVFGDPNEPETQERIKQTVEMMTGTPRTRGIQLSNTGK